MRRVVGLALREKLFIAKTFVQRNAFLATGLLVLRTQLSKTLASRSMATNSCAAILAFGLLDRLSLAQVTLSFHRLSNVSQLPALSQLALPTCDLVAPTATEQEYVLLTCRLSVPVSREQ